MRVLGPLEVFDGVRHQWIGAAKWRALLAALVIHRGRIVSLDRLGLELWGDVPPRGASNLVHGYVMRLRKALGDHGADMVVTRSPGYQLNVPPAEIDSGRFDQLTTEGLAALDANTASAKLAEALALWRGPPFADVPVTSLVQAEAARLEELRLTVIEARIDADLALGRYAGLIAELQALVGDQPLRERLWSQLILALHRTGRRADALATYRQVHTILRDELGIAPCRELRQMHRWILDADSATDRPRCNRCGSPLGSLPTAQVSAGETELFQQEVSATDSGRRIAGFLEGD